MVFDGTEAKRCISTLVCRLLGSFTATVISSPLVTHWGSIELLLDFNVLLNHGSLSLTSVTPTMEAQTSLYGTTLTV